MTFPKVFQQMGIRLPSSGNGTLERTPTGFDYSKVLINWGGQGTYFNPQFCINGVDTLTEETRHSTQVIEDDCIEWLSERRDESKPFMLLYQFKAPHRDWRPDSMYHDLFADFDFPHLQISTMTTGRLAASENMMEIETHLNRRDMKQVPPSG